MKSLGRLVAATVVASSFAAIATSSASSYGASTPSAVPIKHVIEIMLENHTFDDLFGYFPGANGIPTGATFANPSDPANPSDRIGALVAPVNEGDVQSGLNNSRSAEIDMMDRAPSGAYRMDGYTRFPGEGVSSITTFRTSVDSNLQYLARHFELADNNFQPAIAPTLPNVLYAVASTSHRFLSNAVPADGRPWRTIFTELTAARRSWRVYAGVPRSYLAGTVWQSLVPSGSERDLSSTTQFFSDLIQRRLPAFSFVRPGIGYSEEPPEDVGEGDAWLGQLVAAVARSPYWNSTAIFVTYDEGGGFFDHVSPPSVPSSYGYGTRTPLVIVSPWVRRGILAAETTNISVLSFVQHLWGLAPLNALNARQNDLARAFEYNRAPLRPPVLPVAPPATIAFYGPTGRTDLAAAYVGRPVKITLEQNTPGLALDARASGHVDLLVVPPENTASPASLNSGAELASGIAHVSVTFARAGYYRIEAQGPDRSIGWVTVDVGVTPNTP